MRHVRSRSLSFAFLLLCALAPHPVATQSTSGAVECTVVDSHGGVLPGVTVTVVHQESQRSFTAVADAKGIVRFLALPPGKYVVSAALSGFNPTQQIATVTAGQTVRLTLTLSIGALAETVSVIGETPLVDQRSQATFSTMGGYAGGGYRNPSRWSIIPPRTTSFDRIEENRFTRVADAPFSTFSIDVDTASYAYIRRSLASGTLPPKDAVRIEELINYFGYDYPRPTGHAPLAVVTEVARCPWQPRHALLHVGVQARNTGEPGSARRNLVFLLDVSGSMMPADKLPLVRAAMSLLANRLTARDTVAIVVYAGNSGVALHTTPGDRHEEILAAIGQLHAGGSTNGGDGIRLAYRLAQEAFIEGGVNRVILATDGDFNVGTVSRDELLDLIETKRKTGIYLSVLGVGDDNLQDGMMEQLADRGNGNYAYLDTLEEAQKVLVREADATLIPVANDVKIQVEFNPRHVSGYRLIGYENRALKTEDFKDDRKDAGEIGAGQSVTALYEVVPAGETSTLPDVDPPRYGTAERRESPAALRGELAQVKLRYKTPGATTSEPMDVVVKMPDRLEMPSGANIGFSSAVAAFGMMLRNSKDKGQATWQMAADLGKKGRGADPDGYRAQFVRLVEMAAGLAAANRPDPER